MHATPRCSIGHIQTVSNANRDHIVNAYYDTVDEALSHGNSLLDAHKEGVVAAAMLLAATTGIEDEDAKRQVVALNLRPRTAQY